MTNKEALTLSLKNLGVDTLLIDKALIDANIDGATEYTSAAKLEIYKAEYELLTAPVFTESISEGGYSIKYKLGIDTRLSFLANALGYAAPGKATISDASHLW